MRIVFYVLPDGEQDPYPTACRLCEKAVQTGKRVHVHAPDSQTAQDIDRVLWTWKQGSFLAHEMLSPGAEPEPLASVLIGSHQPPAGSAEVLLNLGPDVPAWFGEFEHVLEIVHGDAGTRARSRKRFKVYRDHGQAPETHKLSSA